MTPDQKLQRAYKTIDRAHFLLLYVALIVTFVAVGAVYAVYKYTKDQSEAQHTLCVEVEKLKAAQRSSLVRLSQTLPTLAYYKQHPEDLKLTLEVNREAYRAFAEGDC